VAHLVVVSFRLGGTDGVSIEAAKWIDAFEAMGHHVTTLAGEGRADAIMPELAIRATSAPRLSDVARILGDAELVVVENFVSLPLNVAARDVLYQALEHHRALFHHHDLAWQREQWRDDDTPRDRSHWRHVTINDLSRRELEARGVHATTIRNSFDCDPPAGRRDATRRALGVTNERVALVPTRAIPRKNVEGAFAFAEALGAVIWLLGPAEDGYGPSLDALIATSRVRVIRGLPEGFDVHDAYGASDVVVMPSTWEGFGNPVLESVTHRRALAVYPYPVLREIESFGFRFFGLDDVIGVENFLKNPDDELFDHNVAIARAHFNVAHLRARLTPLLSALGVKGTQLGSR
jgi:glycosyltransferase involved in cell wall biosynthesis